MMKILFSFSTTTLLATTLAFASSASSSAAAAAAEIVAPTNDDVPVIYSENGKLTYTLTIGPVLYNDTTAGTGLVQNLVGYNGIVGGPTIVVKPGDMIELTLVNNLPEEPCSTYLPDFWNEYHAVSHTNLHFHGLHISASDNPTELALAPGDSYTYEFTIPEYHMGGTHWYHPHVSGSSTLQAGGGGVGLFIIEDLENDIPPEYLDLPEVHLRIQFLNMTYLQQDYASGTDGSYVELCREKCLPAANRELCHEYFFEDGPIEGSYNTSIAPDGLEYETTLVNGIDRPTYSIMAGQWYRIRVLYVPTRFRTIEPAFPSECEVNLMSKDGVMLLDVPRNVTAGFMTSGNRADFLIKCPQPGKVYEVVSLSEANDSSQWIASQKRPSLNRVLAYLNVSDSAVNDQGELPAFQPNRPCYVANALGLQSDQEDSFVMLSGLLPHPPDYNQSDPLPIMRPPCCANTSYYDVNGYGEFNIEYRTVDATDDSTQLYDIAVRSGSLWDLNYYVPQIHPAHYHMHAFQIQELPQLGAHADYWQVGDYHDTLHLTIPDDGYFGHVKIRVNIAMITGRFLGHCHFYRHTDRGMAYLGNVFGPSNTYSPELADTCYDSMSNRGGYTLAGDGNGGGGDGGDDTPSSAPDDMMDDPTDPPTDMNTDSSATTFTSFPTAVSTSVMTMVAVLLV